MAKKKANRKQQTTKYFAAPGAPFGDKDAQQIGDEVEQIADREGLTSAAMVTPHMVVATAKRSKRSALGRQFNFEDQRAAAEKWWLFHARQLLGGLEVEIVVEGGKTERTRAWHNVVVQVNEEEKHRGYVATRKVATRKVLASQVIAKAYRDLNTWKMKYAHYRRVFPGVMDAIDEANENRNDET